MLDKLLLQIASDLCSFCHLGNFVGEIPAGRKGNNLFTAAIVPLILGLIVLIAFAILLAIINRYLWGPQRSKQQNMSELKQF